MAHRHERGDRLVRRHLGVARLVRNRLGDGRLRARARALPLVLEPHLDLPRRDAEAGGELGPHSPSRTLLDLEDLLEEHNVLRADIPTGGRGGVGCWAVEGGHWRGRLSLAPRLGRMPRELVMGDSDCCSTFVPRRRRYSPSSASAGKVTHEVGASRPTLLAAHAAMLTLEDILEPLVALELRPRDICRLRRVCRKLRIELGRPEVWQGMAQSSPSSHPLASRRSTRSSTTTTTSSTSARRTTPSSSERSTPRAGSR